MAVNKMLKFVHVSRDMPTKRMPKLRNKDYNEVYQEFAAERQKSNLVDVANVAYRFAKHIAHYIIIFLTGSD